MGKYIKLFETHAAYNAYINGNDKLLPNVSYCENENEVHYNPIPDPRLIAQYTVLNDNTPTRLYCYDESVEASSSFSKVEIDGVEVSPNDLDEAEGYWQLSNGTHTVKYTLINPTRLSNTNNTFGGCSSLTSVTIPDSVTSIGEYDFSCRGLTSVTIGNGVASIDEGAFYGCTNLTNITIPNSVTSIGDDVFYDCYFMVNNFINNSGLDEVSNSYWGATIVDSDADGFCVKNNSLIRYRYYNSNSVIIPDSVTSIATNAFWSYTGLTSVTIPSSVTSIGEYAFNNCAGLTSVTIPNSVTTIGTNAFGGCRGLTSVTINSNAIVSMNYITIGKSLKNFFGTQVTEYVIGSSVTTIGQGAFKQCTNLTNVTIGNSVTSIGENAFNDCSGLTSVTIPDSVTSIERYAFQNCTNLTSITIGSGITSIGWYCFNMSDKLTNITVEATTPPTIDTPRFNVSTNLKIYVPSASVNTYKAASGWSNYASYIEAIP